MSIRDVLKKREEKRSQQANGGINGDLPDGITRYVRMGKKHEVNDAGRTFVLLRDPDLWYFYYVHEDSSYQPYEVYVKKHTCLHSPRKAPETAEEMLAMFEKYAKDDPNVCISGKAGAKRVLYFMIPVYDPEYKTWRVLDTKEFHALNLIEDIEKINKSARKFNKEYTLVGDAFHIRQNDKTYSIESATLDDDVLAEAAKFLTEDIDYEELANFRSEDEIIAILHEANPDKVKKSVLPPKDETPPADEAEPIDDSELSDDPTAGF